MTHAFETQLELSGELNLWFYTIDVPVNVVQSFLDLPSQRRVLCTINGQETIHAGLMPNGRGGWFININQKIRKQLGIFENDILQIVLAPDTSEYGMPMPEVFLEMLFQTDDAHAVFVNLTAGKKRNLIHFINSVKSENIKLRRAEVIAKHLAAQRGIDFKLLYQEIKESNQNTKF